jgi:hypothetical protein
MFNELEIKGWCREFEVKNGKPGDQETGKLSADAAALV